MVKQILWLILHSVHGGISLGMHLVLGQFILVKLQLRPPASAKIFTHNLEICDECLRNLSTIDLACQCLPFIRLKTDT